MNRLGPGLLLLSFGAYCEGALTGWWAIGGLPVALGGLVLIVSADRNAEDVIVRDESTRPGDKLIIAGSFKQAEVAADKLGLERSQWRYVHFVKNLEGATIDDVVLAMPIVSYSQRYTEIVEEVGRIAERDGRKPDTVVFT